MSADEGGRALPKQVSDNPALHRYELKIGDATAFVTYRREPGRVTFIHTEVPKSFGGRGVGTALAEGALSDARDRGDKVVADCPFIAAIIRTHREFENLLAEPPPPEPDHE